MAKKQYESKITESGTWYKVPEYKVMLVKDRNPVTAKDPIKSPDDVAKVFNAYLESIDREYFVIGMLNYKSNLLGLNTVSVGGLHGAPVHPREVFKPAIVIGAASIILAHNHPSGDTTPSKEDAEVTKRLVEAGTLLGIKVLDHIIIGDGYYSFKANGLI